MTRAILDARSPATRAGAGACLALLAAACVSGPDYRAYLGRWAGQTRAQVVANWGPPDYRYHDRRGRESLQYVFHDVLAESLASGRRIVWWCLTTFHIGAGTRVEHVSIEGNHCVPPDDLAADRAQRRAGRRPLPHVPPADRSH